MKEIQKKNKHQKNGQGKIKMMKRIFSIVMVFALAFSLLEVSQGRLVVYAEGEAGNSPDLEPGAGSVQNHDGITVSILENSNYKATQIMNGDFEDTPWEDYVYNGKEYTKEIYNQNKSGLGNFKNVTAIPNGIDGGWNTTENETYKGSLFEVWETAKDKIPVPAEWDGRDLKKNGKNFIEMNANSPAALYQDLATQGGDIIKWTLQHAARVGLGYQEQRMYVTVGSPEKDNRGKIIAAEGVNDRINTHIGDAGKARYNYNEILPLNNNFAFAKTEDLKGLSVYQKVNDKENKEWYDVAGIYVVPAGQEVTRFAFCADGTSKKQGDSDGGLSGGNFLDNITFSTLLGNLNATRQQSSEGNGDVKVTGYWGDEDSSKKLVIEFGDKKEEINMSSVIDKNFEITIPESVIGNATSLNIYHEDYKDATKTINITHKHTWNYKADNMGSDNHAQKVYAYCTNDAKPQCSYIGENNKDVYLTLTAYDAEYTGRAYDSASVSEWSIVDNTLAARPDIKYYIRGDNEEQSELTTNANSGAASEGAAPKNVGKYYAEITVGNASAKAKFEITPKTIIKEMVKYQKSFEYNGRDQKPSVIIMDGDKIYTEGEDYTISWPESPKDIGTYNFTITGKGNCDGVFTIPWNITKASPKITAPSPSDIIYGQTLNESTLSGGKATNGKGDTVEGAFSWNEGSKKPSVSDSKKTDYKVNFIPTDTEHYNPTSCNVRIAVLPKEAELTWNPSSFTYNGENQQPLAVVSNLEVEDNDKVTVNVTVDGDHKDVKEGGYTAKASLDGDRKSNYKLTEEASKKVFYIAPKQITSDMVEVKEKSYIHNGKDSFTPEITVKDGETILKKDKDYTLSGAASGSAVGIYEIKVTGIGNYTGEVEDSFEIKDNTKPTGSIEIDNNKWKSFLNDITFGLFFKETQTVKISASDEAGGSGVDKVYYYLTSDKIDEETLNELPEEKWTGIENGGTFKIDPDNKYIIYTKIIDKSGNVSIISSDGIVVDKTPPVIEKIENNKTYCTDVLFTVTDGIELKSVTIDGEEKGISGKYSIAGTSEKKEHVIEAKDMAGNVTKYNITLNAKGSHSFDGWKEVKKATCEEDGKKIRTCKSCGYIETETIQKLGHKYKTGDNDIRFVWTAKTIINGNVEGYDAEAYFVCENDPNHVCKADTCKVESSTEGDTPAVYTATVTYDGKTYKSTKTTEVPKIRIPLENPSDNTKSGIYTSVSVATGAPVTLVYKLDSNLVKNHIMTDDEKNKYNNRDMATDVTVYLEVQNITGVVKPDEKEGVENKISNIVDETVNKQDNKEINTGAAYLDLSMFKNIKTEKKENGNIVNKEDNTSRIINTTNDIKITIDIPESVSNVPNGYVRNYYVIRVHGNEYDKLSTEKNGNTLSFETNKFSTYAVAYIDVKKTSGGGSSSGGGTSSGTGGSTGGGSIIYPESTATPEATKEPAPSVTPEITVSPQPTELPKSSDEPKPTIKPTTNPKPTVKPTAKPKPTSKPVVTKAQIEKNGLAINSGLKVSQSGKVINVKWGRVKDAEGYKVYVQYCGKNFSEKSLNMIKSGKVTKFVIKKINGKKIDLKKNYKVYVRAYKIVKGKKVSLGRSITAHIVGKKNTRETNTKGIRLNKTSFKLKVGKKATIKGKAILVDKTKKPLSDKHAKELRFASSDKKVATVTEKGVIKAVGKGTCTIYVYARNGYARKVKVTVR